MQLHSLDCTLGMLPGPTGCLNGTDLDCHVDHAIWNLGLETFCGVTASGFAQCTCKWVTILGRPEEYDMRRSIKEGVLM